MLGTFLCDLLGAGTAGQLCPELRVAQGAKGEGFWKDFGRICCQALLKASKEVAFDLLLCAGELELIY